MILTISRQRLMRDGELRGRIVGFYTETSIDDGSGDTYPRPDCADEMRQGENSVHQICLRGDEIIGHQVLVPREKPGLSKGIDVTYPSKAYEWRQPRVAARHSSPCLKSDGAFLEMVQGVVEWGLFNDVTIVTTTIDWCLMAAATQLRFIVRQLGVPKPLGHDEITALSLSFDKSTLDAIHTARGSSVSVLQSETLQSIVA